MKNESTSRNYFRELKDHLQQLGLLGADDEHQYRQAMEIAQQATLMANQYLYLNYAPTSTALYVSPQVTPVAGYSPEEYSYRHQVEIIHPEDQPIIIEAVKKGYATLYNVFHEPLELVLSFAYRLKHKDGHYLRVLRQTSPIAYNREGVLAYYMSIITDISGVSNDTQVFLQCTGSRKPIPDFNTEKFYRNVLLTKREMDILVLLREGLNSHDIAGKLFLSRHTVDTHRRNILKKLEVATSFQAVLKAQETGIIS